MPHPNMVRVGGIHKVLLQPNHRTNICIAAHMYVPPLNTHTHTHHVTFQTWLEHALIFHNHFSIGRPRTTSGGSRLRPPGFVPREWRWKTYTHRHTHTPTIDHSLAAIIRADKPRCSCLIFNEDKLVCLFVCLTWDIENVINKWTNLNYFQMLISKSFQCRESRIFLTSLLAVCSSPSRSPTTTTTPLADYLSNLSFIIFIICLNISKHSCHSVDIVFLFVANTLI